MSLVVFVGFLLGVWLLLWGSITVANLLSGLAVSIFVTTLLSESIVKDRRPRVRPLVAIRLFAVIVRDFLRSNAEVSLEVLRGGRRVHPGVIEVPMPHATDTILTFVAAVLALSPGILPLEVEDDPGTIFIHVLHLDDVERTRASVNHMATLAVKAFGSPEAVAALEQTGVATEEAP